MTIWHRLLAWCRGVLRSCPVCGRPFDISRVTGGRIYLESWGSAASGSHICALTCCRGEWYDVDYVHHADLTAPQVNSKPTQLIVPLTREQVAARRSVN